MAIIVSITVADMTSCKKSPGSNPGSTMATFYFHLQPTIDTSRILSATTLYTDSLGRHIGLSLGQFFIYNVVLQNTNGTSYTVPDAYILTDIDSESYVIGTAPPGTYNSVSFNVGLDPYTNGLPSSEFFPAGYVSSGSMFYPSGTLEYMSMYLLGFADTTAGLTGANLAYFSYGISAANNRDTVKMPLRTGSPYAPYTAVAGGTNDIYLICDYGKLLSGVNFKTEDTTDNNLVNPALGKLIADSIPHMFRYQQ